MPKMVVKGSYLLFRAALMGNYYVFATITDR